MNQLPTRKRYRAFDRKLFTDEFRRMVAEFGSRTTQKGAARAFGVSQPTVKNWMRALGLPSRRTGSPTSKDVETWGVEYPRSDFLLGAAPSFSVRPV